MTAPPPFDSLVVDILIEVPRGSFVKRNGHGSVEFVAPVPCPFNYGSVPALTAPDGDALDAVLLGPRRAAGRWVQAPVRAVVNFIDAGQQDNKLICATQALTATDRRMVLGFFQIYALCKRMMNFARGRSGMTRCLGWGEVADALMAGRPH